MELIDKERKKTIIAENTFREISKSFPEGFSVYDVQDVADKLIHCAKSVVMVIGCDDAVIKANDNKGDVKI